MVLPVLFVIVSLVALAVLPVIVGNHTARMRDQITRIAEPARRAANEIQVGLWTELDKVIRSRICDSGRIDIGGNRAPGRPQMPPRDDRVNSVGPPMFEQERRKADRLHLTPSIHGRMQENEVRLVNIGVLGTTVEHEKPLIVGGPHKLRFKWDGEEIEVDCTVVHSEQKANIFKTGLSFVARPP